MARRNVTVRLDEAVIQRAKLAAIRRNTSLSALLTQQITQLTDHDEHPDRYGRAKRDAFELMDNAARNTAPSSETY